MPIVLAETGEASIIATANEIVRAIALFILVSPPPRTTEAFHALTPEPVSRSAVPRVCRDGKYMCLGDDDGSTIPGGQ